MVELHPYGDFVPRHPRCMIIGSFPIGKFSNPTRRKEIKPHEFDFFFGGEKNLLWKLLASTFNKTIRSKEDIVAMLEEQGIGIGDVIKSCRRKKGGGSDSDLYDIKWNYELLDLIRSHNIKVLLFTGRKVEDWFHRLFPETDDLLKINLISPSGQIVRSLPRLPEYQKWKKKNPHKKAFDFILADYKRVFSRLDGK